jgi:hypothetical protein
MKVVPYLKYFASIFYFKFSKFGKVLFGSNLSLNEFDFLFLFRIEFVFCLFSFPSPGPAGAPACERAAPIGPSRLPPFAATQHARIRPPIPFTSDAARPRH